MDRSFRQKINKETETLNDTLDRLDLVDIYRAFHSKTVEYTFFSSVYRIFFKTRQMLGHKVSLGKFKKIEIIPCIFSEHNTLRLKINYKKKKKTYKTQKCVGQTTCYEIINGSLKKIKERNEKNLETK